MAFTFSEIADPVAKPAPVGSEFSRNILAIPVGKAIIVGGMTQSTVLSRARTLGLQQRPIREYKSTKLTDGRIQITRSV